VITNVTYKFPLHGFQELNNFFKVRTSNSNIIFEFRSDISSKSLNKTQTVLEKKITKFDKHKLKHYVKCKLYDETKTYISIIANIYLYIFSNRDRSNIIRIHNMMRSFKIITNIYLYL